MGRLSVTLPEEIINEMDYQISLNEHKTRSAFVEKAVSFYLSYLISHQKSDYLNASVAEGVRRGISDIERQTMPNIFTLSVELAMLNNIVASLADIDESEINRLRKDCVEAVRATKKRTDFKNALRYQQDSYRQANAFYDNFSGRLENLNDEYD